MGTFTQHQEAVRALIEPILAEQDLELVDLSFHRQGRTLVVRCLIDGVRGVNLQRCASVNRRIGNALEEADVIEDSFTVEVSSPGIDRPLTSTRDFERVVGQDVQLDVHDEAGNNARIKGMLISVTEESLILKTDAGKLTIGRDTVHKATKALPW